MSSSIENPGSVVVIVACLFASVANAQSPSGRHSSSLPDTTKAPDATDPGVAPAWTGEPNKHPLMPAIRWAREALPQIEQIDSYTATLIKRERIGGKLGLRESLAIKVRHKPFSIYVKFLGPRCIKGQEVLYVDGANDGKMWAHGVGLLALPGTVPIDPSGPVAMQGQLYPLTQIGILYLTKRLVEVAETDVKYGECTATMIDHVKINGRPCRCLEVVHPKPRRNFNFHLGRVFIDDKLNIPLRYECYDWPKEGDNKPPLMEEYTYLDVKLNAGLADADFDIQNPGYGFRPEVHEVSTKGELHGGR
jgi:hypothetical protein